LGTIIIQPASSLILAVVSLLEPFFFALTAAGVAACGGWLQLGLF